MHMLSCSERASEVLVRLCMQTLLVVSLPTARGFLISLGHVLSRASCYCEVVLVCVGIFIAV